MSTQMLKANKKKEVVNMSEQTAVKSSGSVRLVEAKKRATAAANVKQSSGEAVNTTAEGMSQSGVEQKVVGRQIDRPCRWASYRRRPTADSSSRRAPRRQSTSESMHLSTRKIELRSTTSMAA